MFVSSYGLKNNGSVGRFFCVFFCVFFSHAAVCFDFCSAFRFKLLMFIAGFVNKSINCIDSRRVVEAANLFAGCIFATKRDRNKTTR